MADGTRSGNAASSSEPRVGHAAAALGRSGDTERGSDSPAASSRKRRRKPRRAAELGVTDEQYEALLAAQHGVCAVCGSPPKTRRLHVDHNHRTGKVRGLLCFRCNRALPTYATSQWLDAARLYVLRDETGGECDVPDQYADVPDQWAAAR